MSQEKPLELSLADDAEAPRGKPRLVAGAYDPYDVDVRKGRPPDTAATRTDLRKLSDWIKLKREVEELKAAGHGAPPPPRR